MASDGGVIGVFAALKEAEAILRREPHLALESYQPEPAHLAPTR